MSYSYIVVVVSNATDFSYGIPTILLQVCCVEEACCYGMPCAAARAWISEVSTPGSFDTDLVCNNPEVAAQVSTLAPQDVVVAHSTLLILSRLAEVQACNGPVLFSRLVVDLRRNITELYRTEIFGRQFTQSSSLTFKYSKIAGNLESGARTSR